MAACGGLEHIFEKPLPLESLSPCKQIKPIKTSDHLHHHSFTEIFGQIYSNKENHHHVLDHSLESSSTFSSPSSRSSSLTSSNSVFHNDKNGINRHKDSISSVNSECLSTCTEELGFESSDDAEDLLRNDDYNICDWKLQEEERARNCTKTDYEKYWYESRRYSRKNLGSFPPPISCIGRNGKPWVCFKSIRQDGRFILKEIRIPTQEFLHACRKDGRLKMQFVQSDDEILDEEDDEEEEENVEENYGDVSEIEDGDIQGTAA